MRRHELVPVADGADHEVAGRLLEHRQRRTLPRRAKTLVDDVSGDQVPATLVGAALAIAARHVRRPRQYQAVQRDERHAG